MISVACVQCGERFSYEGVGGRRRKYCSAGCRNLRYYGRRETTSGLGESRPCDGCGETITPDPRERNPRKWCSESCRVRAHRTRTGYTSHRPRCAIGFAECDECEITFTVRRAIREGEALTCRSESCQKARAARAARKWQQSYQSEHGRSYASRYADKRRAYGQARRARMAGAPTEEFSDDEIFERDKWVCQLCGYPVDPTLRWPHPMYKSLDHRVQISRGGSHTRDNVQLAHLSCNSRKGCREVA